MKTKTFKPTDTVRAGYMLMIAARSNVPVDTLEPNARRMYDVLLAAFKSNHVTRDVLLGQFGSSCPDVASPSAVLTDLVRHPCVDTYWRHKSGFTCIDYREKSIERRANRDEIARRPASVIAAMSAAKAV